MENEMKKAIAETRMLCGAGQCVPVETVRFLLDEIERLDKALKLESSLDHADIMCDSPVFRLAKRLLPASTFALCAKMLEGIRSDSYRFERDVRAFHARLFDNDISDIVCFYEGVPFNHRFIEMDNQNCLEIIKQIKPRPQPPL